MSTSQKHARRPTTWACHDFECSASTSALSAPEIAICQSSRLRQSRVPRAQEERFAQIVERVKSAISRSKTSRSVASDSMHQIKKIAHDSGSRSAVRATYSESGGEDVKL